MGETVEVSKKLGRDGKKKNSEKKQMKLYKVKVFLFVCGVFVCLFVFKSQT